MRAALREPHVLPLALQCLGEQFLPLEQKCLEALCLGPLRVPVSLR